ncbi:MAG: NAD(P)/FAD-dependent oxidoreductase [Acidimicrobiales bacterium]
MPDVVVVGAGIAGLSAAAELAEHCSVRVVEMEHTAAHHATGRSAALYIPSYGPPTIRRLTKASRDWFDTRGQERSDTPLMSHRYVLYASDLEHTERLDALVESMGDAGGHLEPLDAASTRALCPALRSDWVVAGGLDAESHALDVAAIVGVYRRLLGQRGGQLYTDHRVTSIHRTRAGWSLTTSGGDVACDVVVNAAGAWVDVVAGLAGLETLGFEPRRRTLAVSRPAHGADPGLAFVAHAAEEFYFGAEAGGVMFSPADATRSEPCDAKPEEIDIAYAMDRINDATDLALRSVQSSWAGLRTFGPDGSIVIGPDPAEPTFVWCGGQGGYGIHTCPAASQATAALTLGQPLPAELTHAGLTPESLGPARLK